MTRHGEGDARLLAEDLQRADGVLVPFAVTHRLLGLALRGADGLLRRDSGGSLGDDLRVVLDALNKGARAHASAGSARRTECETVRPVGVLPLVPIREAAHAVVPPLSESYVQRLCRMKRVVASRTGRDWHVNVESLSSVTGRKIA